MPQVEHVGHGPGLGIAQGGLEPVGFGDGPGIESRPPPGQGDPQYAEQRQDRHGFDQTETPERGTVPRGGRIILTNHAVSAMLRPPGRSVSPFRTQSSF